MKTQGVMNQPSSKLLPAGATADERNPAPPGIFKNKNM